MLKANKKTLLITSIVTVLPVLIGLLYWSRLPDVMATHFGMHNEANGFSSKAVAVFGLPLFCLAILWLGAVVTSRDPKKQNISPKLFVMCLWIAPIVSLICAATIYPVNLGVPVNVTFIAELLVSVMLIVLGNYLPKCRQNYTIGIKLPWTLANEENWNRTHRFAGYLWLVCGLLMLALSLCGAMQAAWLLAILIGMVLAPFVFSFWLHVKKDL